MKKILIRTDSSDIVGTGHLMRCLTLADALKNKGADVHFICRNLRGNVNRLAEQRGYKLHLLSAPAREFVSQPDDLVHASWLEVQWQLDQKETSQIVHSIGEKIDWLIADSYSLDFRWENGLQSEIKKIMVIDDLADRKHNCEILLDQNYFAKPEKRYQKLIPESSQLLLGQQYSLLREEFLGAKKFCDQRSPEVNRILIYFGGNDHDNLTGLVLKALNSFAVSREFDFVIAL